MKFGDAPYAKEEEQVLFSGFEGETVGLVKTNDIVDGWTVINTKVRVSQSIGAHSGNYYATLSYDSASMTDISKPGDEVVPTSNNSPVEEQAPNAIDDNPSLKYLNFDGANDQPSGLTITTAGGVVSGLGLTSANDAPDRDPATFVLSGSNDGGATFTEIASGNVPAFGARFERQEVFFANDAAYTTYELIFPTTTGPSTCCMQIAEIELLEAKEGGAIWRDLPTAVGQQYTLSFWSLAAGNDSEYVLGGVATNFVEGPVTLIKAIPQSSEWIRNSIEFTAARSSTPLTIRTKATDVLLDTIQLMGPGPHNLAEEPLDVLSGERAMGDWVLEVRDRRVGLDDTDTEIEPMLISWYIKIMGSEVEDTEVIPEGSKPYTRDDTAEALKDGRKVRGRIYDNETHYWTVETCSDSSKLTVELSSGKKRKNAKVSLLASYGGFPSGDTKADDYIQVDMNDSFFGKLVIGDKGHLPLQPGELLYLTVQKTDTNVVERALYDIVAKWDGDCGGGSPPNTSGDIIRLANATGSEPSQAQPGTPARFLWSIPPGTPAVLLEATDLTADADIELISTDGLHYRNSIHLGQAPEQIVLREDDTIPSLEGDWVVQVNTVGDAPSEFTLHTTLADERDHLISPLPIELEIESQFWPPTVRLAWPSVPGELYVLESSENLIDWVSVHEKSADSSGVVFHAERSWFGERYYRVKQITNGR